MEVRGSSPASVCGGRCRQHPLVASPTQPTAEALARLPPFPDPTAMAAAVAESSSSKGPVAARTCFSFGEWVLSSKEINFPYPVALTLLHMVFSSVVCFAITKVFKDFFHFDIQWYRQRSTR